uniref:Putative maverick pol n=1 Tax=Aedes albopictus TaxID=7160 RepID=A0A023EK70_AEDAL
MFAGLLFSSWAFLSLDLFCGDGGFLSGLFGCRAFLGRRGFGGGGFRSWSGFLELGGLTLQQFLVRLGDGLQFGDLAQQFDVVLFDGLLFQFVQSGQFILADLLRLVDAGFLFLLALLLLFLTGFVGQAGFLGEAGLFGEAFLFHSLLFLLFLALGLLFLQSLLLLFLLALAFLLFLTFAFLFLQSFSLFLFLAFAFLFLLLTFLFFLFLFALLFGQPCASSPRPS